MPTVQVRFVGRMFTVDPDRLTPRARALAEAVQSSRIVMLESTRTLRELGADPMWYGPDLDQPHRIAWEAWSQERPRDIVEYLERQAAKLPIGYVPVGPAHNELPPADAARAEGHLIGKAQVLELLRDLGRPISATTLDNYRSRPSADWPQPVRYVGRTPQWDRRQIETYAKLASHTGATS
jgi:hypothetical protein